MRSKEMRLIRVWTWNDVIKMGEHVQLKVSTVSVLGLVWSEVRRGHHLAGHSTSQADRQTASSDVMYTGNLKVISVRQEAAVSSTPRQSTAPGEPL
ncbi:hypothetical protein ElyMa_003771200 [Elysia marginata]|uniref:Uncharacterized protein n=1 Tax=Elysia marginata TaxID=1093978 RepID=A0AAV4FA05_9GAST|nr:hypothetical protein ElyMa_003771200 [Elysia marginata]